MILKQFYLNCLAHASYLISDEKTRVAAVVDPQRDVDCYLQCAADQGLRIAYVVLTHLHADFVAGHLELRDRVGATICLSSQAQTEYAFRALADGGVLEFGRVRLVALHTPGHTPESISLVVYDLEVGADTPYAVLTGDTLFVGDVGRPDLRAALGWSATQLGGLLYDSLHAKLLPLPDPTLVYPAHGAGSLCGKALSRETVSTIGEQRRLNYALQPMSKAVFVDLVTADQPEAPPYFTYDAVLNSRERPTLEVALSRELKPLSLAEVLAKAAAGAQLLDSRDPVEFGAAHLFGSINVGLVGQYATWAGTVLTRNRPIMIIADPGAETESALRLGRIGFDHVIGYLEHGLSSVADRPDLITSTERLAPGVVAARLSASPSPFLLDVRGASERAQKWIRDSAHIPLGQLRERMHDVPADRSVIGRRLTLNLGVRYAHDRGFIREQCRVEAPSPFSGIYPAACFPGTNFKVWNPLSPRVNAAYDLTGDGKTLLKGRWGRYPHMRYVDELQMANRNVPLVTTFQWRDTNGNLRYEPGAEREHHRHADAAVRAELPCADIDSAGQERGVERYVALLTALPTPDARRQRFGCSTSRAASRQVNGCRARSRRARATRHRR